MRLVPAAVSPDVRRRALLAARIAVSVAALWLAFGWVGAAEIASSMAATGPLPISMALGVYLASQGVSAIRWMWIARSMGFALRPRSAIKYYFIGMFFSFFGPSFLGGDFARSLYLARGGARMPTALASVVLDRYVGFVWLAVLASVALLLFGAFPLPARIVWATHALAFVALISWFLLPRVGAGRMPRDFLAARPALAVISLLFHLMQVSAAIILANAVVPYTPWRYCFVFHPLVAMLSALPISIAGLGIRESGYVYFLGSLQGASMMSHAAAFAAAWLVVVTAGSTIGGVVFLLSGGRLPQTRQAAAESDHSTQLPASS